MRKVEGMDLAYRPSKVDGYRLCGETFDEAESDDIVFQCVAKMPEAFRKTCQCICAEFFPAG